MLWMFFKMVRAIQRLFVAVSFKKVVPRKVEPSTQTNNIAKKVLD
ncbi:hypothetical protein T479_03885 [Lysinibacillus varians]|nr:hypothetical protein T479_03885 [Lysinibacillus varians]